MDGVFGAALAGLLEQVAVAEGLEAVDHLLLLLLPEIVQQVLHVHSARDQPLPLRPVLLLPRLAPRRVRLSDPTAALLRGRALARHAVLERCSVARRAQRVPRRRPALHAVFVHP